MLRVGSIVIRCSDLERQLQFSTVAPDDEPCPALDADVVIMPEQVGSRYRVVDAATGAAA